MTIIWKMFECHVQTWRPFTDRHCAILRSFSSPFPTYINNGLHLPLYSIASESFPFREKGRIWYNPPSHLSFPSFRLEVHPWGTDGLHSADTTRVRKPSFCQQVVTYDFDT